MFVKKMWRLMSNIKFKKAPMSPLKKELINLESRIEKDNDLLSEIERDFWENGGTCCPSCGVRGFSDLVNKQERREKRVAQIRKKLNIEA